MTRRTLAIGTSAVAATAALAAALAPASAASAARQKPILRDGTFDTPAVQVSQFVTKGENIGPWRVAAGTVDLNSGSIYAEPAALPAGAQSVDLNGTGPGRLRQVLNTVAGQNYQVTYYLGGNPDGGPAVKTMTVLVDDAPVAQDTFDTTGSTDQDMNWQQQSVQFTATSSHTRLLFASTTPDSDFGPMITGVTATPSIG